MTTISPNFTSNHCSFIRRCVFIVTCGSILFCTVASTAQNDTVIIGNRHQRLNPSAVIQMRSKRLTPLDSEFVIDNKRFQFYNNWVTIGMGAQQNLSYRAPLGFAGNVDVNFHIKRNYFQGGAMLTGSHLGNYTNYQVHLGAGKRFEDREVHVAAFAGISYSTGYGKEDSVFTRRYTEPGLYLEGEIVKKISYDVGLGGSLFADWNAEQSMVGARFIVYFSGAFRGKKYASD